MAIALSCSANPCARSQEDGHRHGIRTQTGVDAAHWWRFGDAMAKPIGPGLQAICLAVPNADRHTGRIRTAAAESAQALAKHQRDPSHARRTGRAWRLPRDGTGYGDRRSLRGLPRTGVRIRAARVRGAGPNLFETCSGRRASTAAGESPGSRSRSAESFLTRGRRATWLGCGRKYATLLSRQAPARSIASLTLLCGSDR